MLHIKYFCIHRYMEMGKQNITDTNFLIIKKIHIGKIYFEFIFKIYSQNSNP